MTSTPFVPPHLSSTRPPPARKLRPTFPVTFRSPPVWKRVNMKTTRVIHASILAVIAVASWAELAVQSARAAASYVITDLGLLNGNDQFSQAFGINNAGQVAGF